MLSKFLGDFFGAVCLPKECFVLGDLDDLGDLGFVTGGSSVAAVARDSSVEERIGMSAGVGSVVVVVVVFGCNPGAFWDVGSVSWPRTTSGSICLCLATCSDSCCVSNSGIWLRSSACD